MKLYLFDFDGTISKTDSMFDFLRSIHSTRNYYMLLLKSLPIYVKYKFKIINKDEFKSCFLVLFLSNFSESYIKKKANEFANFYYHKLNKKALNLINQLMEEKNNEITIVTASLDIWIKPISAKLGLKYISSKAKFTNKLFQGISGKNCWGEEKVRRIKSIYNREDFNEIHAFGDSKGDKEMLNFADFKWYRFF